MTLPRLTAEIQVEALLLAGLFTTTGSSNVNAVVIPPIPQASASPGAFLDNSR